MWQETSYHAESCKNIQHGFRVKSFLGYTFAPIFSLSTNESRNPISLFLGAESRNHNLSARILCHGGLPRLDPSQNIVCMKYNESSTFGLRSVNPAHSYPYINTFLFLSLKFSFLVNDKRFCTNVFFSSYPKGQNSIIKLNVQYAIASYRCFWTLKNLVNFGASKVQITHWLHVYVCGRTCVITDVNWLMIFVNFSTVTKIYGCWVGQQKIKVDGDCGRVCSHLEFKKLL